MRISDWSSDVCSSDLLVSPKGRAIGAPASSVPAQRHRGELVAPRRQMPPPNPAGAHQSSAHKTEYACRARGLAHSVAWLPGKEIGRASCRERVWLYVMISVGVGPLKKNIK